MVTGTGRTGIVLAAAAGTAVIGAVAWNQYQRPDATSSPAETAVAVVPEAPEAPVEKKETPQEVAKVDPPAEPEATPAPRDVAFDEVRREPDGMTIIAGRAEPGASVQVLLDGAQITDTQADGQGKFAAITMIVPDGQGHVLSLSQVVEGARYASADEIILAPLDPPVVVSDVAPEAADVAEAIVPPTAPQDTATPEAVAEAQPKALAPQAPEAITPFETVAVDASSSPKPNVGGARDIANAPELDSSAENQINVPAQDSETEAKIAQSSALDSTEPPKAEQQPTAETSAPKPDPQVAVLKSTEEGVELLNVPRPEALENIALDTISYSDSGEVQLSGRAQSQTRHVQVYLNNSSVTRLAVDDTGRWRGDLPDVDEGIYTLRVDEVAADGSVTSRVETPFKREAPAVLAEAAARADGPLKQITVQKGATLWAIARERYGDGLLYVEVFQANTDAIRDPNLIYPGQVFELPE